MNWTDTMRVEFVRHLLTRELMQSEVYYDEEVGIFRWRGGRGKPAGAPAMSWPRRNGPPHARIRGFLVPYPALVWLHHHGEFPPEGTMAAYIDEARPINRIENLKLVPCEPLPASWGRSARPVHPSAE
jgi:hypothetical protein